MTGIYGQWARRLYIYKKYSLLIRLRWFDIWFHVPRISSIQVNLHQFKDTNSCHAPPSTHNRHLHASPQMIYTPFYRPSNGKGLLLTFSLIRNKDFIRPLPVGLFLLFLPSLSLSLSFPRWRRQWLTSGELSMTLVYRGDTCDPRSGAKNLFTTCLSVYTKQSPVSHWILPSDMAACLQ